MKREDNFYNRWKSHFFCCFGWL